MRIQQYIATDFQGWSKMTQDYFKTAYFAILKADLENFFDSYM